MRSSSSAQPAPLLSVFGGKITTYRKLAEERGEHAGRRARLCAARPWTASALLPGGDLPHGSFAVFLRTLERRYPWLPPRLRLRYAHAYGTRLERVLGDAASLADLGTRDPAAALRARSPLPVPRGVRAAPRRTSCGGAPSSDCTCWVGTCGRSRPGSSGAARDGTAGRRPQVDAPAASWPRASGALSLAILAGARAAVADRHLRPRAVDAGRAARSGHRLAHEPAERPHAAAARRHAVPGEAAAVATGCRAARSRSAGDSAAAARAPNLLYAARHRARARRARARHAG